MTTDTGTYDAIWARLVEEVVVPEGPAKLSINPGLIPALRAAVRDRYIKTILPPHSPGVRATNEKYKLILDCIDDQFPWAAKL